MLYYPGNFIVTTTYINSHTQKNFFDVHQPFLQHSDILNDDITIPKKLNNDIRHFTAKKILTNDIRHFITNPTTDYTLSIRFDYRQDKIVPT